jgi:hypothetical protein
LERRADPLRCGAMGRIHTAVLVSVTALLVACAGTAGREAAGETRHSFDDVVEGELPPGFTIAETNGRGKLATWQVTADEPASEGGRVLRLTTTANTDQTYNLMMLPDPVGADVSLAVRVRADSGDEDQGGGVLWRARDAANYYIARWNPLEDNLRAYKVVNGKRTQLGTADVAVGPGWHDLLVEMRGDLMRVRFDGVELIALRDATFAEGGLVGLWTKADAATSFDDLVVSWR